MTNVIPTIRVVHRESGAPMLINERAYDPALHALPGEELEPAEPPKAASEPTTATTTPDAPQEGQEGTSEGSEATTAPKGPQEGQEAAEGTEEAQDAAQSATEGAGEAEAGQEPEQPAEEAEGTPGGELEQPAAEDAPAKPKRRR